MGLGFSSLGSALLDPENEEAVRNIFKKYDKDKNGSIDKNEFMNFAFDVQEFVKIKGLQENPINLDNQKKLMSFFYFDTDNNGVLSYDEFKECLKKYKFEKVEK